MIKHIIPKGIYEVKNRIIFEKNVSLFIFILCYNLIFSALVKGVEVKVMNWLKNHLSLKKGQESWCRNVNNNLKID